MLLSLILLLPAVILLALTLWNALCWPGVKAGASNMEPGIVSILIPARNEEDNLAGCLDYALAQSEPVVLEILVYDDHSTDTTACIVREYARRDRRVRLLSPEDLPDGWCGKTFACAQLAAPARGRWLLFLDADARLSPSAVARALAEAEARNLSLLSCWPALELKSFWERMLMPLLNFVVFTLYPAPLAFRRDDASLGLAHGSFILVRRDVYERIGGHALVRDEIFEDVRLAQNWRALGERSLCLDGQSVLSVRMYRSLGEIWWGFQKNFFPAFQSGLSFLLFIALHFFVFLLPFVALPFAVRFHGLWFFAILALCVLLMRFALALRFGHLLWSVLMHPLGEAVLIALGVSSWWACRSGRGVEWKGRSYHQASPMQAEYRNNGEPDVKPGATAAPLLREHAE